MDLLRIWGVSVYLIWRTDYSSTDCSSTDYSSTDFQYWLFQYWLFQYWLFQYWLFQYWLFQYWLFQYWLFQYWLFQYWLFQYWLFQYWLFQYWQICTEEDNHNPGAGQMTSRWLFETGCESRSPLTILLLSLWQQQLLQVGERLCCCNIVIWGH